MELLHPRCAALDRHDVVVAFVRWVSTSKGFLTFARRRADCCAWLMATFVRLHTRGDGSDGRVLDTGVANFRSGL
jgi:hypothetical protein